MPFFDQHLHSRHSFDSEADPADCVETAIARGLAGLTFTEHYDTHPKDWQSCRYDDEAYTTTIDGLRRRFGSRIVVGKGIEVCFQPDRMDNVVGFLRRHAFDVVILSVHYFAGRPLYREAAWDGVDTMEGTRRHLETTIQAVRFCERLHARHGRVFDVLGHLDLVKRYTHRFRGGGNVVASFPDLLDEILRACLAADLIPEVNTSTLRQGLDEPMPGPGTIRRYAELGGTCMSLGSDAHRPEDIGRDFDCAATILRTAGIDHTAVFRNRRRETIPIQTDATTAGT